MAYAQAGDEQNRQLDPNATTQQIPTVNQGFTDYLRQQRESLAQFNQSAAPTGTLGTQLNDMRDVSNLAAGANPLTAASTYSNAQANALAFQKNTSKTILDTLVQMATQKQNEQDHLDTLALAVEENRRKDEELAMKKAEFMATNGFDPDTLQPVQTSNAMSAKKQADLLSTRKTLLDQGLDTTVVDEQLKQLGIEPSKAFSQAALDIRNIAEQLRDSNLGSVLGTKGAVNIAQIIPGTQTQKTKALMNQLIAQLKLENRQKLKGQGQISDFEGRILADASTILNKNLSEPDFRKELDRLITKFGGTANTSNISGEWK